MSDDKEGNGTSAWHKVPTWDGSPQTFRAFKREMMWWTQSLDLENTRKYNLAARWLLRQSGVVRQRGEEFLPSELAFKPAVTARDPQSGQDVEIEKEDLLYGLNKLMSALEDMNGKTALDKRGELRTMFYIDLQRKAGERISDFCSRFRVMVGELKAEGVILPPGELGWFLRRKLGLDPLREQLLETALAGREEYDAIERETLRLFKELHTSDPLVRRAPDGRSGLMSKFLASQNLARPQVPTSSASSTTSFPRTLRTTSSQASSRSGFRRPFTPGGVGAQGRSALVAEADDGEDVDEEEELEPDADPEAPQLEEVLQAEAECLASELEAAMEDGVEASVAG